MTPVVLPEAASGKDISSLQLQDLYIGPVLRQYKECTKQPEVEQTKRFATRAPLQQWTVKNKKGNPVSAVQKPRWSSSQLQLIVPKGFKQREIYITVGGTK